MSDELTKEQQLELANAEQQTEAARFMRRNREFKPGAESAKKIKKLLDAEKLDFTAENLEKVFLAHKADFELDVYKPVPVEQKKDVNGILLNNFPMPEWGILTKKSIYDLDRASMRRWMKNPEFVAQVNRVQAGLPQFAEGESR